MEELIIYREDSKIFVEGSGETLHLPTIDPRSTTLTEDIKNRLGFYVEFSGITSNEFRIARRIFGVVTAAGQWVDIAEAAKLLGKPEQELQNLVEANIKHWQEKLLQTIGEVFLRFASEGIDIILFGGWAADFLAGRVTRPHVDIDTLIWLKDKENTRTLIKQMGYRIKDKSKKFQNEQGNGKSFDVYFLDPDNQKPDVMGNVDVPEAINGSVAANLNGVTARVINPEIFKEMLKKKVVYNKAHQAELSGSIDKTQHDLELVEEYLQNS